VRVSFNFSSAASAEVTEERVISGSCALDLRKFAATSSRAVQCLAPSTALLKSELLREHPAFRALRVRPAPAWAKGVISGSCALDLRKFAATSSRAVQRAALDTLVTLHKGNARGGRAAQVD
jgi:hypothetical protein